MDGGSSRCDTILSHSVPQDHKSDRGVLTSTSARVEALSVADALVPDLERIEDKERIEEEMRMEEEDMIQETDDEPHDDALHHDSFHQLDQVPCLPHTDLPTASLPFVQPSAQADRRLKEQDSRHVVGDKQAAVHDMQGHHPRDTQATHTQSSCRQGSRMGGHDRQAVDGHGRQPLESPRHHWQPLESPRPVTATDLFDAHPVSHTGTQVNGSGQGQGWLQEAWQARCGLLCRNPLDTIERARMVRPSLQTLHLSTPTCMVPMTWSGTRSSATSSEMPSHHHHNTQRAVSSKTQAQEAANAVQTRTPSLQSRTPAPGLGHSWTLVVRISRFVLQGHAWGQGGLDGYDGGAGQGSGSRQTEAGGGAVLRHHRLAHHRLAHTTHRRLPAETRPVISPKLQDGRTNPDQLSCPKLQQHMKGRGGEEEKTGVSIGAVEKTGVALETLHLSGCKQLARHFSDSLLEAVREASRLGVCQLSNPSPLAKLPVPNCSEGASCSRSEGSSCGCIAPRSLRCIEWSSLRCHFLAADLALIHLDTHLHTHLHTHIHLHTQSSAERQRAEEEDIKKDVEDGLMHHLTTAGCRCEVHLNAHRASTNLLLAPPPHIPYAQREAKDALPPTQINHALPPTRTNQALPTTKTKYALPRAQANLEAGPRIAGGGVALADDALVHHLSLHQASLHTTTLNKSAPSSPQYATPPLSPHAACDIEGQDAEGQAAMHLHAEQAPMELQPLDAVVEQDTGVCGVKALGGVEGLGGAGRVVRVEGASPHRTPPPKVGGEGAGASRGWHSMGMESMSQIAPQDMQALPPDIQAELRLLPTHRPSAARPAKHHLPPKKQGGRGGRGRGRGTGSGARAARWAPPPRLSVAPAAVGTAATLATRLASSNMPPNCGAPGADPLGQGAGRPDARDHQLFDVLDSHVLRDLETQMGVRCPSLSSSSPSSACCTCMCAICCLVC